MEIAAHKITQTKERETNCVKPIELVDGMWSVHSKLKCEGEKKKNHVTYAQQ